MNDTSADTSEDAAAENSDVKKTADEEIKDAVKKSKFTQKKKKGKKKLFQVIGGIVGIGLLGWLISWGLASKQGGKGFGVCKVFLELQVEYPPTLRLTGARESGPWVRIWYVHTDSFGEYKMERLQCNFARDPEKGLFMESATIERREVNPEILEDFNRSIPVVLQNMPDLTYPAALPTSLRGLKFQTDMFRRQLGIRKTL